MEFEKKKEREKEKRGGGDTQSHLPLGISVFHVSFYTSRTWQNVLSYLNILAHLKRKANFSEIEKREGEGKGVEGKGSFNTISSPTWNFRQYN